ncbi:MAG: M1 family metallopeptidase [Candidatus Bipolaricaulota bacterium]|nr:M1 family metallopeptidase [Candidatus Bipolaricaulota bacterium]
MRALALLLAVGLAGVGAPLRYEMALSLSPDGLLQGEATVSGTAPADWTELVFRLYPAALDPSYLRLTGARTGDQELPWTSPDPTTVAVSHPVPAGGTFSVTLEFSGQVPSFAQGKGYGTFARSASAVVLAQAYPILAPWNGSWTVRPALPWGDSTVAEVADYSVGLVVPPGWTVVATGREEELAPRAYRVVGENLREFAWVVLRGYAVQTASACEVEVRSYFPPDRASGGAAALEVTRDALRAYTEVLGPHPFPELDLVAVPLRGAAGVEYPGLILAGEGYYGRYSQDPLFFPMIFAHELAHQWWYAEVGADQVGEPWVDEALTTYTSGLYFERAGRLPEVLQYWEAGYAAGRSRNPEARITSPLSAFPGGAGYGGIVYSGGALFLHAVRGRMGDEAFFRALRRFRAEFRWRIAPGKALLALLREESPAALEDLFETWLGP